MLPQDSAAAGTIRIGASLTAGDITPWLSAPNQEFAFGFRRLQNQPQHFVLAIWYNKIEYQNIVWYPIKTNPAPTGSKLLLTPDRGFVLTSPTSEDLWASYSKATAGGVASFAFFNDTGNLVITSSDQNLWESFKHPSDTMLPSQILPKGGAFLSSRHSETDFSLGKYRLRLLADGNLVLNTVNLPTEFPYDAYYHSDTASTNASIAGYQVVFNESGSFYVLRANNERVHIKNQLSAAEFYLRATLHFDGVFSVSYFPKNDTTTGSWSTLWTVPDNICAAIVGGLGTGPCGYNSVCRITDGRPACRCPQHFSLLDGNDPYGGCTPDHPVSCEPDGTEYDVVPLLNVNWPTSDYERLTPSNIEDCKQSCLQDCLCAAAITGGSDCWKKKLPLSNGREELGGSRVFIKVRKTNPILDQVPGFGGKKNQDSMFIVISVLFGTSAFINLVLLLIMCMGVFFIYNKRFARLDRGETIVESNVQSFTNKQLAEATNGYKEELGRGSFGIVYRGEIHHMGSKVPIAVKKLDRVVRDSEKEFKAEVNVIGQTHHKNLVRLLGFCNEGQNRLLVYELLSNGTLASLLFGDLKPSWNQRTQIALGIGRGLVYLHEECSTQIIHCDIKPQNILLDDYYNARIADFGLAKLLMLNQSDTHTGVRGTKGYVAPEWFRNTAISVKVDVYSFGVLLLEIICCRKSVDMESGGAEKAILSDWAYDCYREGTLDVLVDNDEEVMSDMKRLKRYVMVAIWCIQEDPSLRPTMKKVMLMLEGIVQVSVPPCPCPYTIYT